MNDDHLDRLKSAERRLEKLETDLWDELKEIRTMLNAMAVAQASKPTCPQPGLCLQLQSRQNDFGSEMRQLRAESISLQKWQSGIMAALVLIGILITFFGPAIRHTLGIPQ